MAFDMYRGGSARYIQLHDFASRENHEKPLPSPNAWGRMSISAAHVKEDTRRRFVSHRPRWLQSEGWRTTVMAGASIAVGVMIVNFALFAWSLTKPIDPDTGARLVTEGLCSTTSTTFTYSHLAINILSTILLATSNATMQCLSAPTRKAIDRAHGKGQWLDIGISGLRNWSYMDRWRQWCWILLVVSSIPLHILYNSAVFQTTSANEYFALAVTPEFLNPGSFFKNETSALNTGPNLPQGLVSNLSSLAADGKLQRLDNYDCIQTYGPSMVNQFSNVLLVTSNHSSNNSLLEYTYYYPTPPNNDGSSLAGQGVPYWVCGDPFHPVCDYSRVLPYADQWNLTYNPPSGTVEYVFIDYCLLQESPPFCTVQIIPDVMIVVVLANAIKVACFVFAVYKKGFEPLITLGDGLESFLKYPDPQTEDLGPLSAADLREAETRMRVAQILRRQRKQHDPLLTHDFETLANASEHLPLQNGPWSGQRIHWFSGASGLRWGLTYTLIGILWGIGWILWLFAYISSGGITLSDQWNSGFGNVSPQLLIEATASVSILGNILIANSPQLLLSLAYISYNGLLTCILLSREFTLYSRHRRGLRVSRAESRFQRSSYWLTLPYQFSVPLLILSGFIHWALSQSVFLAEVKVLDFSGAKDPTHSVSCLGYSTLAILVTLILGAVMLLSPLVIGWIRYEGTAPLVESCTLAISAASHPAKGRQAEAGQLIKYGVLADTDDDTYELAAQTTSLELTQQSDLSRRHQRVGMSSGPVKALEAGGRYTARPELAPETVSELSPANMPRPRWRKALSVSLLLLNLVKFALLVFCITLIAGPSQSPESTAEINAETMNLPTTFALFGLTPLSIIYVIVRLTVDLVRRRKKWAMRLFGWHVATEFLFWGIWLSFIVVLAVEQTQAIQQMVHNMENEETYAQIASKLTPNPFIGTAAALFTAWTLSLAGESYLWWRIH